MRITKTAQSKAVPVHVLPGDVVVKIDAKIAEEVVYKGATEFVPTEETQIIPLEGMKVGSNIVIQPIPKEYGKISYNGTVLSII